MRTIDSLILMEIHPCMLKPPTFGSGRIERRIERSNEREIALTLKLMRSHASDPGPKGLNGIINEVMVLMRSHNKDVFHIGALYGSACLAFSSEIKAAALRWIPSTLRKVKHGCFGPKMMPT